MWADILDVAENPAQPRLPEGENRFLQGGSPAMEQILRTLEILEQSAN